MKRYFAIVVFALLVAAASAQTSSSTEKLSTREDVIRLFDVMQIRPQLELVSQQLLQQMRGMGREELKDRAPAVTPQQLAKVDAMTAKVMQSVSISDLLEDMIPVYQKHLSKADVDEMIKFYSTPTGQKILREMPAMTAEGMQAMQPRIHKQMNEIIRQVDQMVKSEQAKPGTTPHPAPKKN